MHHLTNLPNLPNLPNFSNLPPRKNLPYVSLESEGCESAEIALKLVALCIL